MPHNRIATSTDMRITFLFSSLWLSGGVLLAIEYANRLVQRGHSVTLVIPGETLDLTVRQKILPEIKIHAGQLTLRKNVPLWQLPLFLFDLVRVTPSSDVLIATHTPTTAPALLAKLLGKANYVSWLYMDFDEMFHQRPVERRLLHWMPRLVDQIMTISKPLANQAASDTKKPVVVTGAGLARSAHFVDIQHRAYPDRARDGQHWRLLYVGDPRPRKGLQEFLAAAALVYEQIPNLELMIVSKEPCTVTTDVPHQLHIYPSDAELVTLYQAADLFVSCSWGEGLGYPPLEAMVCGTPVVLTDSQGVRDYARHEENCLVVPPRDPAAIAAAVVRLLTEQSLRERAINQGLETVHRYEWDAVIDRVEGALGIFI